MTPGGPFLVAKTRSHHPGKRHASVSALVAFFQVRHFLYLFMIYRIG